MLDEYAVTIFSSEDDFFTICDLNESGYYFFDIISRRLQPLFSYSKPETKEERKFFVYCGNIKKKTKILFLGSRKTIKKWLCVCSLV